MGRFERWPASFRPALTSIFSNVLFHRKQALVAQVNLLRRWALVDYVDFWPDLGAQQATLEHEGADEVAVAIEVLIVALVG